MAVQDSRYKACGLVASSRILVQYTDRSSKKSRRHACVTMCVPLIPHTFNSAGTACVVADALLRAPL